MASTVSPAVSSGDLIDLVASTEKTTIYPTDDAILNVLQGRFRADLPYTRIGALNLVVVNPLKTLANINDANAREYEERCYKDTSVPTAGSPRALQPHLYDMAAKAYLLMRQRRESQAVVFRYVFNDSYECLATLSSGPLGVSPVLERRKVQSFWLTRFSAFLHVQKKR